MRIINADKIRGSDFADIKKLLKNADMLYKLDFDKNHTYIIKKGHSCH